MAHLRSTNPQHIENLKLVLTEFGVLHNSLVPCSTRHHIASQQRSNPEEVSLSSPIPRSARSSMDITVRRRRAARDGENSPRCVSDLGSGPARAPSLRATSPGFFGRCPLPCRQMRRTDTSSTSSSAEQELAPNWQERDVMFAGTTTAVACSSFFVGRCTSATAQRGRSTQCEGVFVTDASPAPGEETCTSGCSRVLAQCQARCVFRQHESCGNAAHVLRSVSERRPVAPSVRVATGTR